MSTPTAPVSAQGRSVVDYVTQEELMQALSTVAPSGLATNDWLLSVPDAEAEEQTVEGEMSRLLTLKSYLVLDAEKEEAFDKLTQEACDTFGVPTSLISLIDLGRQFFLSNTDTSASAAAAADSNIPEVRETPRSVAFCAHTILNKKGIVVVNDTVEDDRFKESPLVTQAPHLRFYAGAPLISPEGMLRCIIVTIRSRTKEVLCTASPLLVFLVSIYLAYILISTTHSPLTLFPMYFSRKNAGHKLGTFCVEGPEPRPKGLNAEEQEKLKEYAAKTMELMVERRKNLRDRLSGVSAPLDAELRMHAAVTTNLGDMVYVNGDSVTAMRLFQESVQTIMYVQPKEDDGQLVGTKPSAERQAAMAQFLALLSVESVTAESRQEIMGNVVALYKVSDTTATAATTSSDNDKAKAANASGHLVESIPGLFSNVNSKLRGMDSTPRPLPCLVFAETFKIDLVDHSDKKYKGFPLDELPFTVSLGECAKATLFNMGLVHYHWKSPEMALQLFHLAASVSHKFSPLAFDPVDLACVNNMAQIHLQYRRPDDAMKMLTEALTRGNKTLADMYSQMETSDETMDDESDESPPPVNDVAEGEEEEQAARRTRRLRRKLARTLLNLGHVHFFNCDYDAAMKSCRDAMPLLDHNIEVEEVAAVWYNMSLIYYHQGNTSEALALTYLDKFLDLACKLNGPDHVQNADALYLKGLIQYEMGNFDDCMGPLSEALKIRRLCYGDSHGLVAESLSLLGRVHLARADEVDLAVKVLTECRDVQLQLLNGQDLTFEISQTLLDLGRAYQAVGDLKASLATYLTVMEWSRKFFGARHAFVARIAGIVGNLYAEVGGHVDESKRFLEEAAEIQKEL
jgi:tetratricopeptide (TPR) repeat protein